MKPSSKNKSKNVKKEEIIIYKIWLLFTLTKNIKDLKAQQEIITEE